MLGPFFFFWPVSSVKWEMVAGVVPPKLASSVYADVTTVMLAMSMAMLDMRVTLFSTCYMSVVPLVVATDARLLRYC